MIYRIWDTKEKKFHSTICGKSCWGREKNAIKASTRLWMEKDRYIVRKYKLTLVEE